MVRLLQQKSSAKLLVSIVFDDVKQCTVLKCNRMLDEPCSLTYFFTTAPLADCEYVLAMVQLYTELGMGQLVDAQQLLENLVQSVAVFAAVRDVSLDPGIRAHLVDLLLQLHETHSTQHPKQIPLVVRKWENAAQQQKTTPIDFRHACAGAEMTEHEISIVKWTKQFWQVVDVTLLARSEREMQLALAVAQLALHMCERLSITAAEDLGLASQFFHTMVKLLSSDPPAPAFEMGSSNPEACTTQSFPGVTMGLNSPAELTSKRSSASTLPGLGSRRSSASTLPGLGPRSQSGLALSGAWVEACAVLEHSVTLRQLKIVLCDMFLLVCNQTLEQKVVDFLNGTVMTIFNQILQSELEDQMTVGCLSHTQVKLAEAEFEALATAGGDNELEQAPNPLAEQSAPNHELEQVLLNLIRETDHELASKAFVALTRIFYVAGTLKRALKATHLVCVQSTVGILEPITIMVRDLYRIKSQLSYSALAQTLDQKSAERTAQDHPCAAILHAFGATMKELDETVALNLRHPDEQSASLALSDERSLCGSGDSSSWSCGSWSSVQSVQALLKSLGVHKLVCQLMHEMVYAPISSLSKLELWPDVLLLMQSALSVTSHLCVGSVTNKDAFYSLMNKRFKTENPPTDLTDVKPGFAALCVLMANGISTLDLLVCLHTGNARLCVQLSQHEFRLLVDSALERFGFHDALPQLMPFFRAVTAGDFKSRSCQTIIEIFLGAGHAPFPNLIVDGKLPNMLESSMDSLIIEPHIAMLELLTICCQGQNLTTELNCQPLLELPELVERMQFCCQPFSDELMRMKTWLLQFCFEAYLNVHPTVEGLRVEDENLPAVLNKLVYSLADDLSSICGLGAPVSLEAKDYVEVMIQVIPFCYQLVQASGTVPLWASLSEPMLQLFCNFHQLLGPESPCERQLLMRVMAQGDREMEHKMSTNLHFSACVFAQETQAQRVSSEGATVIADSIDLQIGSSATTPRSTLSLITAQLNQEYTLESGNVPIVQETDKLGQLLLHTGKVPTGEQGQSNGIRALVSLLEGTSKAGMAFEESKVDKIVTKEILQLFQAMISLSGRIDTHVSHTSAMDAAVRRRQKRQQTLLAKNGVVRVIVQMAVHWKDDSDVFCEIMRTCEALLSGGSHAVQEKFFIHLQDGKMLHICHTHSMHLIEATRQQRYEQAILGASAALEKSAKNKNVALKAHRNQQAESRFIHLLCEDNNRAMQHLCRNAALGHQEADMVTCTVKLLELMAQEQDLTIGGLELITQLIETASELVQGKALAS